MKRISIVIPSYNEADSLPELLRQLQFVITQNGWDAEIIVIDDGSTDNTSAILSSLRSSYPSLRYIRFRKNMGKAVALRSGFDNASGDFIVMMDADLQDDPNDIPILVAKLQEGFDAVTGWKKTRKDPWHKVIPSRIINAIVRSMYGITIHDMNCGLKAFTRPVVQEIELYGELYRYMLIFAHSRGFKITELATTHHERKFGKSKFGISRIIKGFFDLFTVYFLTRYRRRPLHFFGTIGLLVLLLGITALLYLTIVWFQGETIGNRPLLIFGVLLVLAGIQLIITGFIAELIISKDTKQKPPIADQW